jgi:hypothetical protein
MHLPERFPYKIRVVAMTVMALSSASLGPRATGAATQTPSSQHVGSVKDSPGYTPPVDPEASSEFLGRRVNAPRVSKPFTGGVKGLNQFGRTVTRLIQYQRRDSLERLCVRSDEFRDILWREFPQSRPVTGIQWEDAWFFLQTRNHKGCGQAISELGGQECQFLGVTCDSTKQYKNFKMYSKLKIIIRDANADTVKWDWVKAIVERNRQFKILALRD